MHRTDANLLNKCESLRKRGVTLGQIVKATGIPKTTAWEHIQGFNLSSDAQEELVKRRKKSVDKNTKRINDFNRRKRKERIKSFRYRKLFDRGNWSQRLVFLIAHFMFDGRVEYYGCEYYNRNDSLIREMGETMEKIFNLHPKTSLRDFGVKMIRYNNTTLAFYINKKKREIRSYIQNAPLGQKKIFLRAFFDDEGSVGSYRNNRKIRGYQRDLIILKLVQKLLQEFGINSYIIKGKRCGEIAITKRANLIKFQNKINFSKGIYINPERKNSTWKKKIEKRKILQNLINSYL